MGTIMLMAINSDKGQADNRKNQGVKCASVNTGIDFVDSFFFRCYLLLPHCFFLLSAFLSSKSFRNNRWVVKSFITTSANFFLKYNQKKKI